MSDGYPAEEIKHEPITLIDQNIPTIIIVPNDSLYDKIVSNVQR